MERYSYNPTYLRKRLDKVLGDIKEYKKKNTSEDSDEDYQRRINNPSYNRMVIKLDAIAYKINFK